MPELPEVETVRRSLERVAKGEVIAKVTLFRQNLRTPFPKDFAGRLKGRRIERVQRRAKYLLLELSGGLTLLAHLGMSGCFRSLPPGQYKRQKHDHVHIEFKSGRQLVYADPRRFGLMDLVETKNVNSHVLLKPLGPEPLGKEFSAAYLARMLKSRKGPVKPVLMDQTLVVGVGNIYASEALFRARISPLLPAPKAAGRAAALHKAIRAVLKEAIASGGSSLRDFFDADGSAGYFQHRFDVYDREKKACRACKTPIVSLRQAGRTTFYCAKCQK